MQTKSDQSLNRCPKCGYTKEDALIHWDHHLCGGKIPGYDPDAPSVEVKTAKLPKESENGITHYVQVGKFLLAHGRSHPAKVWIEIANDGEGGEFNQSDLELVLREFYDKHF